LKSFAELYKTEKRLTDISFKKRFNPIGINTRVKQFKNLDQSLNPDFLTLKTWIMKVYVNLARALYSFGIFTSITLIDTQTFDSQKES